MYLPFLQLDDINNYAWGIAVVAALSFNAKGKKGFDIRTCEVVDRFFIRSNGKTFINKHIQQQYFL
jgi:hypothetical protein